MLTIIFNWLYILFTCFCMGFVFSRFVEKYLNYSVKRLDSVCMAGLVMAAVYAQIFSLFGGVGAAANLILTAACIGACAALRHRMAVFLKCAWRNCPLPRRLVVLLMFFVWSYFTSRGYMVPDMNLYHGQSIRWIEEYGVVKGLGNLHMRFGYNSSVFALSALYSMKFLLGYSLHAVNGLIAFLLSTMVLEVLECFRRRKMLLSDYARAGAAYYLTTIWDEIIAPSSDYAVMCTLFFIVIKWLSQLEEEDRERRENIAPYALLCVAAVYALTLKVTAGLILVLTVKPAYRLLAEKRWKEIGIYLLMGLVTAVPWMIRTVLITGWLLYPSAAIDLFRVDWKVPEEILRGDAYCIRTWGRGSNQLADGDRLLVWFPNWFRNELSLMEKILVLGDWISCVAAAGMAAVAAIKRKREKLDMLLVLVTMAVCYLFWQFNAPMPRYGYAYILLLAALLAGYIIEEMHSAAKLHATETEHATEEIQSPEGNCPGPFLKKGHFMGKAIPAGVCYMVLTAYGLYKLYVCGCYIAGTYRLENYIWQETYVEGSQEHCEMDGVTIYYSSVSAWPGYDPFPAAPEPPEFEFELRGEGLKDGFRHK
ncbi:MAG TPA: hypothetical protein DCZ91_24675 [Lachnospiraceae bacterium]|nr:hypothetical protein [Lachnospiraceae bacterium]